jgi:hypothetical protein
MKDKILMFVCIIMMLMLSITALIGGGWVISMITGFTMLGSTAIYTLIWVILVVIFFIAATSEDKE